MYRWWRRSTLQLFLRAVMPPLYAALGRVANCKHTWVVDEVDEGPREPVVKKVLTGIDIACSSSRSGIRPGWNDSVVDPSAAGEGRPRFDGITKLEVGYDK